MAASSRVYRLIRFQAIPGFRTRHVLLCLRRAGFSNASAVEEARAEAQLHQDETNVLAAVGLHSSSGEMVCELQGLPVGERLMALKSPAELPIWYAFTSYGHPWAVLGTSETEREFWDEVEADEDLRDLRPAPPATCVVALCLTNYSAG